MSLRYWLIIAALGIGWGASFFFNEILLRELGPVSVSMGRVAFGALGCWIWVIATGGTIPMNGRLFVGITVLGAVQYALPFALYALAQQAITSGAAGIVNAMTPIMVVIVSHFWPGGERATLLKSLGVVCGFAGICILALPALRAGGGSELWGLFLAVLAPLCYAFALNYSRGFAGPNPAAIAAWGLTMGAVLITPLAIGLEGVPVITRPETWAALAVIGFVLTSAAFIVLYKILPVVGPTNFSTVTFIAPVSAVLLGVLFLNERVSLSQALGLAAIFGGLLLIDGRIINRKVE